jgi:hypothetical protein
LYDIANDTAKAAITQINGLYFNGDTFATNNVVEPKLTFDGTFTIEMWIRPT